PTAQTSFGARATTPFNWLLPWPGLGVATVFHLVPSQCIAKVASSSMMASLYPTAQASLVASADAPSKNGTPDPPVITVHVVPSQCSNSAAISKPASSTSPTAQISLAEVAVMAKSCGE